MFLFLPKLAFIWIQLITLLIVMIGALSFIFSTVMWLLHQIDPREVHWVQVKEQSNLQNDIYTQLLCSIEFDS